MATPIYPQQFYWSGSAMVPVNLRACARQYTPGEVYNLDHREERSAASHAHEFAWLHEAWATLPEPLAFAYPTSDHLRKRALIEAGYFDETITDCGSNAAALRVASRFRSLDDFALVIVRGPLVAMRTAKSQSHRAMDRKTFQASKTAILEVVAGMLGVTVETLQQQGQAT